MKLLTLLGILMLVYGVVFIILRWGLHQFGFDLTLIQFSGLIVIVFCAKLLIKD